VRKRLREIGRKGMRTEREEIEIKERKRDINEGHSNTAKHRAKHIHSASLTEPASWVGETLRRRGDSTLPAAPSTGPMRAGCVSGRMDRARPCYLTS
jgi:hypothetical protein